MDSRNRGVVVVAIAVMVIVVVIVAIILFQGHAANDTGMTPVMSMTNERSAPGDFNFTVVAISKNDVRWSEIQLEISPIGDYATTLPSSTAYIGPGNVIGIANLTPNSTYRITLKYTPTGGAIYQVILTAT